MNGTKQIGICMDHSYALVMDLKDNAIVETNIQMGFTHDEKVDSLIKNEKHMHTKEQHEQASYYKKLIDTIKDYHEVLLFGPTEAKDELLNLLKTNRMYESIKIVVKHSDKMTDNQKHAFVREYFKW